MPIEEKNRARNRGKALKQPAVSQVVTDQLTDFTVSKRVESVGPKRHRYQQQQQRTLSRAQLLEYSWPKAPSRAFGQ